MAPVAAGMALPILTLPIMTRWLTPEDYGVVAVSQVVAALFTGIASLGVSTGLERNFFKHEQDRAVEERREIASDPLGRFTALEHQAVQLGEPELLDARHRREDRVADPVGEPKVPGLAERDEPVEREPIDAIVGDADERAWQQGQADLEQLTRARAVDRGR